MEDGSTKCLFFRYSDKMDTRSKSKERAQAKEALAKARAVEDSEEEDSNYSSKVKTVRC